MTTEIPVEPEKAEDLYWPIWAADVQPKGQSEHLPEFEKWMKEHAAQLWTGQQGLNLQRDEHDRLRTRLAGIAKNARAEVILVDWWDRLIAAGNQLKLWSIELLPPVVRLPESRPAFVRRDFQLLRQFRSTEAQFVRSIVTGVQKSLLGEAALCSAVMFGGIVSLPFLEGLLRADWDSMSGHEGCLSLILTIPDGKTATRLLRWYPDALTGVLLVRALENATNENHTLFSREPVGMLSPEHALDLLGAAIGNLRLPGCGDNRVEFLRSARVAMALHVPGYIAAYLAGEAISHTLPAAVLRRLCGWRQREDSLTQSASDDESKTRTLGGLEKPQIWFDAGQSPADQMKALRDATAILRKGHDPITRLQNLDSAYSGQLWPITSYLLWWARWLLGETSSRQAVEPSTAERYLKTIARHLVDIAETEDVLGMDPEDFESLYELAGERVKGIQERTKFWAQIRSFHDYLWLCGAPQVDLSELDGYESGAIGNVSANLITEREFELFKDSMTPADGDPFREAKEWILLVAILGFRAGLRRREIQMLWLSDIHPEPDPFLIVKSSKLARLKSASSHRRIPLQPLLPKDELKLLLDVSERRRALLGDNTGLLFAHAHTPSVPLPQALLFDPVTQAFQEITAPTVVPFRFHHLRHSFANWLFLRFVSMDQSTLIDPNHPLFDSYMQDRKRVSALREYFFPRVMGTTVPPGRRYLYLVSSLLGHLNPVTTLKSYIHLLDWIAGREVEIALGQRLPKLGPGDLGAICGLSPSMPFKKPYQGLTDKPAAFFRRFIQSRLPTRFEEAIDNQPRAYDFSQVIARLGSPSLPHPVSLMIALARHLSGLSLEYLENVHSIPREAMDKAREAYLQMFAKQSVKTPKKHVPLPLPPRARRDQTEFWRILETTYSAFENVENRPMMRLAAEALIRRTGPNAGHVYFGKKVEDAPEIVKGLLCMGVPQDDIKILKRSHGHSIKPRLQSVITAMERLGVTVVADDLNWPKRKMANTLLRLDINVIRSSPPYAQSRWKGRINGINYSAMWLRFASSMLSAMEKVSIAAPS